MQLVAYGAQDIYLTGNPQITFFKVVYRRHTNFSMEAIEQTWNGTSIGSSGGRCTATISRNGDLVHRMYLELDTGTSTVEFANSKYNYPALKLTDIELEIGGQKIDKHSGAWMETWAELTEPNPSGRIGALRNGTTQGTLFQNMSGTGGTGTNSTSGLAGRRYFLPLQFWFCRNPGLALPLIALQYHEVKVILNHLYGDSDFAITGNTLFCDYIYLDTDERRRFAQVSHEYLIEQVQEQTLSNASGPSDLNFNHPVKELIWIRNTGGFASDGCMDSVASSNSTYQIKLNGHDRFAARDYRYFTRTQVWQYHSGAGGLDCASQTPTDGSFNDGIAVYSFALKPEEHQPSGTCNFSRIDNAQLVAQSHAGTPVANTIFAVNYNVLRIMSGMGGLAYSN